MTVKQKQALLAYLDYYCGRLDGIWGDLSRKATEAFQRDYRLTVDGAFGVATEKRILEVISSGEQPVQSGVNIDTAPDWWKNIKYFTRDEVNIGCPCGECGGFPAEPTERLMRAADAVREHFGVPMSPTSTVRCKTHNAAVSGAWNSRHMEGRAMDFRVKGKDSDTVLAFVQTLKPSYAYKIDGSAVHMDF